MTPPSNLSDVKMDPPATIYRSSIQRMFYLPNRSWASCRDSFHMAVSSNAMSTIFYGSTKIEAIARMFEWVETALHLKPEFRTTIHPTNHDGCVAVVLSPFWNAIKLRFYFVTIMIRAADRFPHFLPLGALMKVGYCSQTFRATQLFLTGHTSIEAVSGDYTGWVTKFRTQTTADSLRFPSGDKGDRMHWFVDGSPECQMTAKEAELLAAWAKACRDRKSKEAISDQLLLHVPGAALLVAAKDFLVKYKQPDGTCKLCARSGGPTGAYGVPHTATCYVGIFEKAIAEDERMAAMKYEK